MVKTFSVPGMHCGHCEAAVARALEAIPGVDRVDVDLQAKVVRVEGENLEPIVLAAAIDDAGYDAVETAV